MVSFSWNIEVAYLIEKAVSDQDAEDYSEEIAYFGKKKKKKNKKKHMNIYFA